MFLFLIQIKNVIKNLCTPKFVKEHVVSNDIFLERDEI